MRFLITILLTTFLANCGITNPLSPKTDMNKLVADVQHGDGNDYVGKTIKIDATIGYISHKNDLRRVLRGIYDKDDCYYVVTLQTNEWTVDFHVETCDDEYVEGKTYTFQIYISSIEKWDDALTGIQYIIVGELK